MVHHREGEGEGEMKSTYEDIEGRSKKANKKGNKVKQNKINYRKSVVTGQAPVPFFSFPSHLSSSHYSRAPSQWWLRSGVT